MIKIRSRSRSRRLPAALLGALAIVVSLSGAAGAAQSPAEPSADPVGCSTDALRASLHIDQVTVTRAEVNTTGKFTPSAGVESQFGGPFTGLPAYCDVTLTQTDSANNHVTIKMWLPDRWNGRFQGVGGGGFACGINYGLMATALNNGYASASTNCGHDNSWLDGSFALNADRTLNHPLIDTFASVGIHDMTVTGKAVTSTYYARNPAYSYFNGCSNGGRMGLMEAQRYPDDYDGIASGAPATNLTRFIPALIWPQLVMKETHDVLPTCKQQAFKEAVVKACDRLDGVTDGVIGNPDACHWNANRLIGLKTACGTITRTDSAVMAKILQGPRSNGRFLWYGLEKGAALSYLGTVTTTDGVTTGQPMPLTTTWLGTWLQRNPDWDWHTLTYDRFTQLFNQGVREFSSTLASDNPDLSAFRENGGKIVLWHGLADPLIFPQGTVNYYQRVQQASGGAATTNSFARLFLAPGAEHCAGGAGPAPSDPLAAVVNWVEHGQAPKTLPAALTDPSTHKVTLTRTLCAYPLVARYTGRGDTTDARNYRCAADYAG
ncbi:tannase/feruloyl esterase family alpha/beta hydrolase [Streptomyces mirabilis]|uniref:tannase/feruloyl esterase family alpha/beta hydrolase n=1 Tax=Streptomyces mirabilis TaxID=68239 RepID=UPI003655E811